MLFKACSFVAVKHFRAGDQSTDRSGCEDCVFRDAWTSDAAGYFTVFGEGSTVGDVAQVPLCTMSCSADARRRVTGEHSARDLLEDECARSQGSVTTRQNPATSGRYC